MLVILIRTRLQHDLASLFAKVIVRFANGLTCPYIPKHGVEQSFWSKFHLFAQYTTVHTRRVTT